MSNCVDLIKPMTENILGYGETLKAFEKSSKQAEVAREPLPDMLLEDLKQELINSKVAKKTETGALAFKEESLELYKPCGGLCFCIEEHDFIRKIIFPESIVIDENAYDDENVDDPVQRIREKHKTPDYRGEGQNNCKSIKRLNLNNVKRDIFILIEYAEGGKSYKIQNQQNEHIFTYHIPSRHILVPIKIWIYVEDQCSKKCIEIKQPDIPLSVLRQFVLDSDLSWDHIKKNYCKHSYNESCNRLVAYYNEFSEELKLVGYNNIPTVADMVDLAPGKQHNFTIGDGVVLVIDIVEKPRKHSSGMWLCTSTGEYFERKISVQLVKNNGCLTTKDLTLEHHRTDFDVRKSIENAEFILDEGGK